MIAICDYDAGNIRSVQRACTHLGYEYTLTRDRKEILAADHVILPGVGAFGDAAEKLRRKGMDQALLEAAGNGTPLLGICLGMQLLFERSYEYGVHRGLGLLPGEVRPISERIPSGLKIPQMGWNALKIYRNSPLFRYIHEGDYVYFVHSYAAVGCGDALLAATEYGAELTACAGKENVFGCQFHPEKSGSVGLNILRGFSEVGKAGEETER